MRDVVLAPCSPFPSLSCSCSLRFIFVDCWKVYIINIRHRHADICIWMMFLPFHYVYVWSRYICRYAAPACQYGYRSRSSILRSSPHWYHVCVCLRVYSQNVSYFEKSLQRHWENLLWTESFSPPPSPRINLRI